MNIYFHTQPTAAATCWRQISEYVGIASELVDVAAQGLPTVVSRGIETGEITAILLDVASLKAHLNPGQLEALAARLAQADVFVLLLVGGCGEPEDWFVKILTRDVVMGVNFVGCADRVGFPAAEREFSQELAGHSFAREPGEALTLEVGVSGTARVIMSLGQSPAFVCVPVGRAKIFVWATDAVFDVTRPLKEEKEFELSADRYVPAIIFLRAAFNNYCWHNPRPGAGIVIDDPLLKQNYGFINFPHLLGSARKHRYHVTLAFIPWNYRRSRIKNMRLFQEHADCFSVCAHGCDHTNNEFKSNDYEGLLRKNFVAQQRMEQHHQRTGLACEPLMVCPQEQYSMEGIRAFADSRQFLGLVNTGCMPRDLTTPQICGADLLLAAQDSFFGFPVFKRHYWNRDMAVFAMSLFLGKPAILVEHHEFFRDGSGGAEAFASGLIKVRPNLKWTSLADTVMRTHMRRRVTDAQYEVRFFTDTFYLEHEQPQPVEYRLTRRIPETTNVQHVTVNGCDVPFSRDNGMLVCKVRADHPQELEIRVVVPPVAPTKAYPAGLKYQSSVAFRRGLSEFRDNFVARNDLALKAGRKLMRILKQTGGK